MMAAATVDTAWVSLGLSRGRQQRHPGDQPQHYAQSCSKRDWHEPHRDLLCASENRKSTAAAVGHAASVACLDSQTRELQLAVPIVGLSRPTYHTSAAK